MDLSQLSRLIDAEKISWSQHILKKMHKRQIKIVDIIQAIKYGEIIEEYPDDSPYPSCLILGYTKNENPIHIVCALGEDKLWMITAYYPDSELWEGDYKTRR